MLVELIGRLFAALPEGVVKALCYCGGWLLSPWPRGRLVYENMRMALGDNTTPTPCPLPQGGEKYKGLRPLNPLYASQAGARCEESSSKKLKKLAFEACERTFELGLMAVAGQFFSKERWTRMIAIGTETRAKIDRLTSQPRGILLLIPHTTLMEALTALPVLVKQPKRVSVLYRAFGSPELERMVLGRREQHGVSLLNRSTGMRKIIHELQEGQIGGLLFDQNSGEFGQLISFMGRIAAASDLPDVVYRYARPIPVVFAIKRTGFWRGELIIEELQEPKEDDVSRGEAEGGLGRSPSNISPPVSFSRGAAIKGEASKIPFEGEGVGSRGQGVGDGLPLTIQAARWLEKYLRDEKTSADWLWTHKRWKVLDRPRERFGFANRKVLEIPTQKKTKIFIRLPNWLGDVVMALPVLRALRLGRPDAEITLLCRSAYIPLLKVLSPLPRGGG